MQPLDPRQVPSGLYSSPAAYSMGVPTQQNATSVTAPAFGYSMLPTKMAISQQPQASSFSSLLSTVKEVVAMVLRVVEMVYSLFGGAKDSAPLQGGVMSPNGAVSAEGGTQKKSGGFLDKIIPYISKGASVAKEIFNFFSPQEKAAEAVGTVAGEAAKESGGGMFDSVKSFGSSIWSGIKSVGSSIWDGIKGIGSFFGSLF